MRAIVAMNEETRRMEQFNDIVTNIKHAKDFVSVEDAITHKNKAPGKCVGYYFIDTDIKQAEQQNDIRK